ncbi:hypothetical protein EWF20_13240 [Sulfolobus sp. S-194]|uniref:DUF364 domain-containing protein n=1 Tax=Sulfolobus sp. S-194 TaxID=2512240 RepID=UPI001437380B|nr:DUF364 domain-containing protein [Sulfolobus sp. S-194]QIW24999.1 hypothetical protein EWF20_13240 [Sulfolobus sp. S-194]
MILDEIIEELKFAVKGKKLINTCVGVTYTASLLNDGSLGIAHTVPDGSNSLAGELLGMNLEDVITLLKNNSIERGVLLSILNAVSDMTNPQEGDPLDLLEGGKLCVFGYAPRIDTTKFSSIIVYDFLSTQEKNQGKVVIKPFSTFRSEVCDSTVIFGSALVNGSIDTIVKSISTNNLVLEGISSVFAPKTLKNYGFNMVGKIIAIDKLKAFRIICEGGDPSKLATYTRKIYAKLD